MKDIYFINRLWCSKIKRRPTLAGLTWYMDKKQMGASMPWKHSNRQARTHSCALFYEVYEPYLYQEKSRRAFQVGMGFENTIRYPTWIFHEV